MDAKTFDGGFDSLSYVLVTPDGAALGSGYPLLLMLHGFGASMYDLASLSTAINPTGYVYAFPNAPYRMPFGGGQYGYSWFVDRPGVEPPPGNQPGLDTLLDNFLRDLLARTNARPGNIAIGGFSQGGGIALCYGLPHPDTFAGVACLSGAFFDNDIVKAAPESSRSMPIYMSHGRFDSVVPMERGHGTRDFLIETGYKPDFREYDMAHEIPSAVVRDLTSWLEGVLPPKA